MYRWVFFSSVLLLVVGCSASSTAPEGGRDELIKTIDAIVEEGLARDRVVGTSIAVQKSGELIIAKGYGFADLENQVEATERTVYRLGSVTKGTHKNLPRRRDQWLPHPTIPLSNRGPHRGGFV